MSTNGIRSRLRGSTTAALATLMAATAALVVPAAPAHAAAVSCRVDYKVLGDWHTGFTSSVTVTNLGEAWSSLALSFRFTGDQRIVQAWGNGWTQSGDTVTIKANGAVAAAASASLGFSATYTGSNTPPTDWRVNGVACGGDTELPRIIVEPSTLTVTEPSRIGGEVEFTFTFRASAPPPQTVYMIYADASVTGGKWWLERIGYTISAANWNIPQTFYAFNEAEADSVNDVAVIRISVPGYQDGFITVTQIDTVSTP